MDMMDKLPRERPAAWRTWLMLTTSIGVVAMGCRGSEMDSPRRSKAAADVRSVPTGSGNQRTRLIEKHPRAAPDRESLSTRPTDDDAGLWVSPTQGPRIALSYLPVGTELIAVFRPADILAHPEGVKTAELLAPAIEAELSRWQQDVGIPWERVEQITVGLPSVEASSLRPTCIIVSQTALDVWRRQKLDAGARVLQHGTNQYLVQDHTAFYLPTATSAPTLVVCPVDAVQRMMEAGKSPPPMRRSVEQLVSFTDADRLVTIVFPPTFLSSAATRYFGDAWPGIRQSFDWLLGHDIHAVHVSLHVDEHLFMEVQVAAALDLALSRWAASMPARLEKVLKEFARRYASVSPDTYGYELLHKGPEMVAALSAHTRVLRLRDVVVMRCYLPPVAAHNLAAMAMLFLNSARNQPSSL